MTGGAGTGAGFLEVDQVDLADSKNFAALLQELRPALNTLSKRTGAGRLLMTAAMSSPIKLIKELQLSEVASCLDHFQIMAYDVAGPSWCEFSIHQANRYAAEGVEYSQDATVKTYLTGGVPTSKLLLGIPLYGKVFPSTDWLGIPHNKRDPQRAGQWESAVWNVKALPQPRTNENCDTTVGAAYLYDASKNELVLNYDNPEWMKLKMAYVCDQGLAGRFCSNGDKNVVTLACEKFGGDVTPNILTYPDSNDGNLIEAGKTASKEVDMGLMTSCEGSTTTTTTTRRTLRASVGHSQQPCSSTTTSSTLEASQQAHGEAVHRIHAESITTTEHNLQAQRRHTNPDNRRTTRPTVK